MDNQIIRQRLTLLRTKMQENGIDYYMIPTADYHSSEYVSDYFKVREYFCNFSGSSGTLLVWQEGAGLWTDGRYFIQAQKELEGTGVLLFRMLEEGVPTISEFLEDKLLDGQTLGFDGRVISAREGRRLEEKFAASGRKIAIVCDKDPAEEIWSDRPAFPAGKITVLDREIAGRGVADKLSDLRKKLSEAGADGVLLTKLDDLMWLFNIRGCDVECNPVAMSYGYITRTKAVLFLQEKILDSEVRDYFEANSVELRDYGEIAAYLENLAGKEKILADPRYCSYALYRILAKRHTVVEADNPTEELKAVKNATELAHMREIYLKDSVALTKFIYWLKSNIGKIQITEVSAAEKLEEFRREIPEFFGPSFPTIAGYGPNAAMMHYEAAPDSCAVLKPQGLLLVDSGGQYLGGTTDVTRTIALGPVPEEQKKHYTLVAGAMLQLTHARWLHGCTGRNLDILARQPLWNLGLDYQCGTGHGVGYILNVHEGPQSMRWRFAKGQTEAVLEQGMDITNEPGVYIEGSHGIRIENVMVAQNDVKNEYGQFMHFETLTWVPIDMDAIDEKYLTETTRTQLSDYQREVFEKVSPYLNGEEREWLKSQTLSNFFCCNLRPDSI